MLGPPMSISSMRWPNRDARLRRRLDERIQIHDDDIDRGDAMLPKGGPYVVGTAASERGCRRGRRVQRLDAAVQDFREAGHSGDAGDRYTGRLEGCSRCRRWRARTRAARARAKGTKPVLSETRA